MWQDQLSGTTLSSSKGGSGGGQFAPFDERLSTICEEQSQFGGGDGAFLLTIRGGKNKHLDLSML